MSDNNQDNINSTNENDFIFGNELKVFPQDLVTNAELVEDIFNQRGDVLLSKRKVSEKEISILQDKVSNMIDLFHKDKSGNIYAENTVKVRKSDSQQAAINQAVKEALIYKLKKITNAFKLKIISHIKIVLEDLGYQKIKENFIHEETNIDIVAFANDIPLIACFAIEGDLIKVDDISYANKVAKEIGARYTFITNGLRDLTLNANKGVEHALPKYEDVVKKSLLGGLKSMFIKPKPKKLMLSVDQKLKERSTLLISKILKKHPEYNEKILDIIDFIAKRDSLSNYLYSLSITSSEYYSWANHIYNVLIISIILAFLNDVLDEHIAETLVPAAIFHKYYITSKYRSWTIEDDIENKQEALEFRHHADKTISMLEGKPHFTNEVLEIIRYQNNPQDKADNTMLQILAIAKGLEAMIRGRGKKKNDSYGFMGIPAALKRMALFAQKGIYNFDILDKLAVAYGEMLPYDTKTKINKIIEKCEFKFARCWFPWGYPHKVICSGNGPIECKILENMGSIRINHKTVGPSGEYMICGVLTKNIRDTYKKISKEESI